MKCNKCNTNKNLIKFPNHDILCLGCAYYSTKHKRELSYRQKTRAVRERYGFIPGR